MQPDARRVRQRDPGEHRYVSEPTQFGDQVLQEETPTPRPRCVAATYTEQSTDHRYADRFPCRAAYAYPTTLPSDSATSHGSHGRERMRRLNSPRLGVVSSNEMVVPVTMAS